MTRGRLALSALACAAALGVAYAPMLTASFAHHDQYRYFAGAMGDGSYKLTKDHDTQYEWLYHVGRPIAAELEQIPFRRTFRVADLTALRWAVALELVLGALLQAAVFRRAGLEPAASVALSISIFCLPGVQNAVFMTNFANATALLLASLAWLAASDGWRRLRERGWRGGGPAMVALAAAMILLSQLTYPALSFLYIAGTLARLLFSAELPWATRRTDAIRDLALFLAVSVAYYAVVRLFLLPAPEELARYGGYVVKADPGRLPGQLGALATEASPRLLNLWNIHATWLIAAPVALVALTGVAVSIARPLDGDRRTAWERAGWIGALLLAACSFFLIAAAPFLYRLFVAAAAALGVALVWSAAVLAARWKRDPTRARLAAALILATWGSGQSLVTSRDNVRNSRIELEFVRDRIGAYRGGGPARIHLVMPGLGAAGFNGRPMHTDEFNVPTTRYSLRIVEILRTGLIEARRVDREILEGLKMIPLMSASATSVSEDPDGLFVTNERGERAAAVRRGSRLIVEPWRIAGDVDVGRGVIAWSNGTTWRRVETRGDGLVGAWHVDVVGREIIAATWSAAGEPVVPSPNTIVIDMNDLLK